METGDRSQADIAHFAASDAEQVENYSTVSALAVVSLVLGLASLFSFAGPVFLAIPLFGAAVSIVALRRIANSDGALVGRWAAASGLVLCVAFATASVTRGEALEFLRTRRASDFGRQWLAIVSAGRLEEAFRSTTPASQGAPPPEPGAPPPETTPLEDFSNQPIIQSLVTIGEDARIEHVETVAYEPTSSRQYTVTQRFRVAPAGGEASSRVEQVDLTIHRARQRGKSGLSWFIGDVASPSSSG